MSKATSNKPVLPDTQAIKKILLQTDNEQTCIISGIKAIGDLLASIDAENQAILEPDTINNTGFLLIHLAVELSDTTDNQAFALEQFVERAH